VNNERFCDFCQRMFKHDEKPFSPVNSDRVYHWKCYVKKVKEQKVPIYTLDEELEYSFVEF